MWRGGYVQVQGLESANALGGRVGGWIVSLAASTGLIGTVATVRDVDGGRW